MDNDFEAVPILMGWATPSGPLTTEAYEEILGDLCRCGFAIEDLTEPVHGKRDAEHGSFGHRAMYIAPYVRIKARRLNADNRQFTPRVILPGS